MSEKKQKNFQKSKKVSDPFYQSIEKACEGLIYVSETDAPVTFFRGSAAANVTGEIILQQTGHDAKETVEEIASSEFFSRLTTIKDWFGTVEKARAKKFLDLQKLIEENLSGVKVFRVGKVRIDILVVGRDLEGRVSGVRTSAVET